MIVGSLQTPAIFLSRYPRIVRASNPIAQRIRNPPTVAVPY